jgi:phosphoesterase RecJ-like protein
MNKLYKEVDTLFKDSKNILITGHINPDDDAYGSVLAMYYIAQKRYKNKNIFINIEGNPTNYYSFLKNYHELTHTDTTELLEKKNIDLLILLDGNNWGRFTKKNLDDFKKGIEKLDNLKTICIDHHQKINFDKFDIYLQGSYSSTAEFLYEIFVENLGVDINIDLAYMIMTGIMGDTMRFLYPTNLANVLRITREMVSLKDNIIEDIHFKTVRLSSFSIEIFKEFFENITVTPEYTYSYISDRTAESAKEKRLLSEYKDSCARFVYGYIRNIGDNYWGYTASPDIDEKGKYKVTFNSVNNLIDTSIFARELGGGGHKAASGCTVEAGDINSATEIINKCIKDNLDRARM